MKHYFHYITELGPGSLSQNQLEGINKDVDYNIVLKFDSSFEFFQNKYINAIFKNILSSNNDTIILKDDEANFKVGNKQYVTSVVNDISFERKEKDFTNERLLPEQLVELFSKLKSSILYNHILNSVYLEIEIDSIKSLQEAKKAILNELNKKIRGEKYTYHAISGDSGKAGIKYSKILEKELEKIYLVVNNKIYKPKSSMLFIPTAGDINSIKLYRDNKISSNSYIKPIDLKYDYEDIKDEKPIITLELIKKITSVIVSKKAKTLRKKEERLEELSSNIRSNMYAKIIKFITGKNPPKGNSFTITSDIFEKEKQKLIKKLKMIK